MTPEEKAKRDTVLAELSALMNLFCLVNFFPSSSTMRVAATVYDLRPPTGRTGDPKEALLAALDLEFGNVPHGS